MAIERKINFDLSHEPIPERVASYLSSVDFFTLLAASKEVRDAFMFLEEFFTEVRSFQLHISEAKVLLLKHPDAPRRSISPTLVRRSPRYWQVADPAHLSDRNGIGGRVPRRRVTPKRVAVRVVFHHIEGEHHSISMQPYPRRNMVRTLDVHAAESLMQRQNNSSPPLAKGQRISESQLVRALAKDSLEGRGSFSLLEAQL